MSHDDDDNDVVCGRTGGCLMTTLPEVVGPTTTKMSLCTRLVFAPSLYMYMCVRKIKWLSSPWVDEGDDDTVWYTTSRMMMMTRW